MSINWVMLHETQAFVRLPGEKPIWKSSPRTSFALTSSASRTYPAHYTPINIHSSDGTLYLTNQRVVYLPKTSSAAFQSFSASLMNLHDTHIVVPWFGPNSWQAIVQPVPGGNIISTGSAGAVELKLTFKEGGAPDFETHFNRIKERLQQVVEMARQSNHQDQDRRLPRPRGGNEAGLLNGVSLDSVHLDELPSYQASGHDRMASPDLAAERATGVVSPVEVPEVVALSSASNIPTASASTNDRGVEEVSRQSTNSQPPLDAPPGYEETQQQSIQAELDRRLNGLT